MCQQCIHAVQRYWPGLTNEERGDLLMCATSFPLGSADMIERQVKEMAERTGGNLGMALWIAEQELDFTVLNNWRWIWPQQYVGVSHFAFAS